MTILGEEMLTDSYVTAEDENAAIGRGIESIVDSKSNQGKSTGSMWVASCGIRDELDDGQRLHHKLSLRVNDAHGR